MDWKAWNYPVAIKVLNLIFLPVGVDWKTGFEENATYLYISLETTYKVQQKCIDCLASCQIQGFNPGVNISISMQKGLVSNLVYQMGINSGL